MSQCQQKGVVNVWSADSRGALTPLRQYKKKGEIRGLVFCMIQPKLGSDIVPVGRGKGDLKTQLYSPAFFFGTNNGLIAYADDLGHCTDVQKLSSSIDVMMFFEEWSRLIVINRGLLLIQYHVADDGKVTRVMQVKLSIIGDVVEKGIRSICWAGPGILAMASEERFVRVLDLAADESYNLSMQTALGAMFDRSDRVTRVAFGPIDRCLAVGTQAGLVAVWKFNGEPRDLVASNKDNIPSTSSSDWEV